MQRAGRAWPAAILCVLAIFLLVVVPVISTDRSAAGDEADSPRLMGIIPEKGGEVGRDVVVALCFDRPMDTDSLAGSVSFDPAVNFTVCGEADCLVVPVNLLQGGRKYVFRMEPGKAKDEGGRACKESVELVFFTRDDSMALDIPALAFHGEVVEGEEPQAVADSMGFGVGHYPKTGRPGVGNLVLMAHASGLISFPFNRLRELRAGDEIRVEYGGRIFVYRWKEGFVVTADAMWIIQPQAYPMLTIFVCCAADGRPSPTFHPPYRYVVRAALSPTLP